MDDDFLLSTRTAVSLYHEVAAPLPILDYHCHLPAADVAGDRRFRNLTDLWLSGDHYKWRAMRSNGVPERLITGDATDEEKFQAWARTVPSTLRNPLYHWTHLELAHPFGEKQLLGPDTAQGIFERTAALLGTRPFTARGLLRQFRVQVVCTTDDPTDTLAHHVAYRTERARDGVAIGPAMFPTWRPDRAVQLHDLEAWNAWVDALEVQSEQSIDNYRQLLDALARRHAFFHELGCRASDHGLEKMPAGRCLPAEADRLVAHARARRALTSEEIDRLAGTMLLDLASLDHARGWVQQFHLGALRNNNTRMMKRLGPDTGFDSIGAFSQPRDLIRFLDELDAQERLTRTILYNLNPADNEVFATLIGNFQDGSEPGKLQFGAAWWFLDQLDGMQRHLDALSALGLLARFVGMTTDSRSFLSYSRHAYFRRLLCRILGAEAEAGLLPADQALLAGLVRDVCYENARRYFRLEEVAPAPSPRDRGDAPPPGGASRSTTKV